jgi:hypothetical protein
MKYLFLIVATCLALSGGSSAGKAVRPLEIQKTEVGPSLCTKDEVPIASCPIGRRLVSICGRSKRATYRFGRPGKIELEGDNIRYNFTGQWGGGESQIALSRGSWRYVLYDGMVRTGFRGGLLVLKNRHIVSDRKCGSVPLVINSSIADDYMPSGPETDHEPHLDF